MIPPVWIDGIIILELTRRWRSFGLGVRGLDYFSMGRIVNGVTTRFDPHADQYQSWIGGYLVKSDTIDTLSLQDCLNLAHVDQHDWLRHYGDRHPLCELHESDFHKIGEVSISGFNGSMYMGGGVSKPEPVKRNISLRLRFVANFMAKSFNLVNPALKSRPLNFIPTDRAYSNEPLYLYGYFVLIPLERGVIAVLYGNGALYTHAKDQAADTFSILASKIVECFKNVRIERLKEEP